MCSRDGRCLPSREGSAPPPAPEGGLQSSWQSGHLSSPQLLRGHKPTYLHPVPLHRARPRLPRHTFLWSNYLQLCQFRHFRPPLSPSVSKPLSVLAQPWPRGTSHTPPPFPGSASARTADPGSMGGAVATGQCVNNQVVWSVPSWFLRSPKW